MVTYNKLHQKRGAVLAKIGAVLAKIGAVLAKIGAVFCFGMLD